MKSRDYICNCNTLKLLSLNNLASVTKRHNNYFLIITQNLMEITSAI